MTAIFSEIRLLRSSIEIRPFSTRISRTTRSPTDRRFCAVTTALIVPARLLMFA